MSHADNQQERFIKIGWITGFVDGEGCFSIGLFQQPDRENNGHIRRGYKTGYQAFHEFAVTQGEKSLKALELLRDYFGVGKLYLNTRHDNHKEHFYRYVVRKRTDLLEVIIPFFRSNQLKTMKQTDFEKFASCVEMMEQKEHLSHDGLRRIVEIVSTMNRKKSRKDLIKILRDHTPASAKAE